MRAAIAAAGAAMVVVRAMRNADGRVATTTASTVISARAPAAMGSNMGWDLRSAALAGGLVLVHEGGRGRLDVGRELGDLVDLADLDRRVLVAGAAHRP